MFIKQLKIMKIKILIALLLPVVIINCNTKDNEPKKSTEETSTQETTKQLRHVVLFKFKDTATSEDIKTIESAFADLPSKIEEIKGFEWGINNSPEGLNKEFTHCFFLTFDSSEGRDVYLPHPAHKAFSEIITPHLEDVLVVDYWVN